jgi:NADH-quinone oxidoreductase subunit C
MYIRRQKYLRPLTGWKGETYDFYGVNFVGHPNLKRILNVDEMDYFPMRKEYPLEEQTRVDKDDEMFGR